MRRTGSGVKNLAKRALTPALEAALLVMIAGYADAIGFLQFRAFAGQMTGNTILLAISMVEAGWLEAAFYVAVIGAFLIGVVISGGLVRLGWAPAVPLSLSAAALAICAFVTVRWGALLLAFAMGAQNAAATRFGDATINTCSSPATCRSCSRPCSPGSGPARYDRRRPGSSFWRWSGWNTSSAHCSVRRRTSHLCTRCWSRPCCCRWC